MSHFPTNHKAAMNQDIQMLPLDHQSAETKRLRKKCAELQKHELLWRAYSKSLSALIDDLEARYPSDRLFRQTGRLLLNGQPEQALHAIFTSRFLRGLMSGGHQNCPRITKQDVSQFFAGRKYQLTRISPSSGG